jgi:hypothetical protein
MPSPILRSSEPALTHPSQVAAADRAWFDAHPGEDQYIREFVPGEFSTQELPSLPSGFRYATHVSVVDRCSCGCGVPVRRHRQLMAVC